MADLTFRDVLIIGGVAFVGFTLLFYAFSVIMVKKGWTWQAKNRPPKAATPQATVVVAPPTGSPAKSKKPTK